MTLPEISQNVYVTDESVKIISHEKMYVSIPEGTLWAPLNGFGSNSVILYGDMEYAADIIHETENGARGRSFKDTISGYKIYLGGTNFGAHSSNASYSSLNVHNYQSVEEFLRDAQTYIESYEKLDISDMGKDDDQPGEGKILWQTDENKKNVLFVNGENIGLVIGKLVHVLGSDSLVMVDNGTVVVQNYHGKDIIIDRNGIKSPPELRDLGKNISKTVKDAMKNINIKFNR